MVVLSLAINSISQSLQSCQVSQFSHDTPDFASGDRQATYVVLRISRFIKGKVYPINLKNRKFYVLLMYQTSLP